MSSTVSFLSTIFATALYGGYVGGTAVDVGYYPPNSTRINNITNVLNTKGIYGFIFNSSDPADVVYGTYNWCNMPHARQQEYERASNEYTLIYVELIHRHHKRTVYASNSFPVESYGWNCSNEGLYSYGQPSTGNRSARTFWEQTTPSTGINPFNPSGFLGSCSFPQITAEGLEDSWQHGKDLYGVYHDLLGFIPDNITGQAVFRVTRNSITTQVAGMVINGMFGTQEDVPLHIQATGIDSLEPAYTCVTSARMYSSQQNTSEWNNHLTKANSLFSVLDNISGVLPSDPGFHASFDHYYDNLSSRLCHSKPLPCKLVNNLNSTNCVTQSIADTVFRLGQWEYSYIHRDCPHSLNAAVGSFGVWIAELAAHIRSVISGKSKVLYFHNIAHDGSLSRLLSILQVDVMVWPGMGAEVVFEVYEQSGEIGEGMKGYYMRALWGGKVLRSSSPSLGIMDMVPLENVLGYFDALVGKEATLVVGKCNGTIAY